MRSNTQGYTPSTEYKHPNACGLFSEEHQIPDEVAEVLDAIDSEFGDDIEVAASGCGSCYTTSKPLAVFYTAQRSGPQDDLYLKFDADEGERNIPTREGLGRAVCRIAEAHGVEWTWNGNTDKAIGIGLDDGYDENIDVEVDA